MTHVPVVVDTAVVDGTVVRNLVVLDVVVVVVVLDHAEQEQLLVKFGRRVV